MSYSIQNSHDHVSLTIKVSSDKKSGEEIGFGWGKDDEEVCDLIRKSIASHLLYLIFLISTFESTWKAEKKNKNKRLNFSMTSQLIKERERTKRYFIFENLPAFTSYRNLTT
ncbi:hypothetical protein TNIN_1581 [Trichonephila inaurata madagascariensis]|uniref:Uncharacterized protein n=1 Tax=Trichonephila inaurata madagascariensis TaxID=2747483 RepID=A0A8X7BXK8_9ARAC|nr:hypothetical protein TNIN_1581 [Trichonephila inaurata madagascariensis]